ncbi:hypothetical protein [Halorussus pelagicus]|uniref:hypothetical protein n=1 Tax=Halorussus pelagicus TaxID=2505977 RepID=UPI000FFC8539|nr:hypothetical protein [Halorussus pelagicus]
MVLEEVEFGNIGETALGEALLRDVVLAAVQPCHCPTDAAAATKPYRNALDGGYRNELDEGYWNELDEGYWNELDEGY